MFRSIRQAMLWLVFISPLSSFAASCIWVATDDTLKQVAADTNLIAHTVALKETRALAMNATDCSVWALAGHSIYQFDANGVKTNEINLRSLGKDLDDSKALIVDPYDASLWLSGESKLVHLSSSGAFLNSTSVAGDVRAMSIALDETVWLLSGKWLKHFNRSGVLLESRDLSGVWSDESSNLAVDSMGGVIWIGGAKRLIQLSMAQLAQTPKVINLPHPTGSFAFNPLTGEVWIATNKELLSFTRAGTSGQFIDLQSGAVHRIDRLAFDPVAHALWAATEKSVARFTDQGAYVMSLAGRDSDEALGVPAFAVSPVLTQIRPVENAVTKITQPVITYGYDANCNGQPCGFASSYFSNYSLIATLDKKSIGPFTLDNAGVQASYTPSVMLADGAHALSAQAKDAFSHQSAVVTGAFTVDTIPPKFLSLAPPDFSVSSKSDVTIQGTIDDITGSVVLNGVGPATLTSVIGQTLSFNFPVHLVPGPNTFNLTAIDKAGNINSAVLHLALSMVTPLSGNFISLTPVVAGATTVNGFAGAVKSGLLISVTNTRTGASVKVAPDASGAFIAKIDARAGDVISVTAIDQNGNISVPMFKAVPSDPANPDNFVAATGYVSGSVYDAATGTPLAGVSVHARGIDVPVSTGADGKFTIPVPGSTNWALFFQRSGYIDARRDTYVRPGGNATVGAVAIRAENTIQFPISAVNGGNLTDPTGNVQVIFPAGALTKDANFSATFLPTASTYPLPLPGSFVYAGGVQMGPEHTLFSKPVTVRVKNQLGIAAGTQLQYFFASHDEDDAHEGFYDPGVAIVSADGQYIEYQVMHFSCMALGVRAPGTASNANSDGPPGKDPGCEDCQGGGSRTGYSLGNLQLNHHLTPFMATGLNDSPTLGYDTSTADPHVAVSSRILPVATNPPLNINATVTIEGNASSAWLASPAVPAPFNYLWQGTNGQGQVLPNGSYPYTLSLASTFPNAPGTFTVGTGTTSGTGSASITSNPVRTSVSSGVVVLNNQASSPFGAGWSLDELARIYPSLDGTLLLTEGSAKSMVFNPVLPPSTASPVLASGFRDPRSLATGPDGSLYVSDYGTGSIYKLTAGGGKTLVASGMPGIKGITVAPDGTFYAVVERGGQVYRIGTDGIVHPLAQLSGDHFDDIAISPADGNIYVIDGGIGQIHKITPLGQQSLFYDNARSLLTNSLSMAFDSIGNLYVSNNYNYIGSAACNSSWISVFDQLGNHQYFRTGLNSPRGITVASNGDVLVADYDCTGTNTFMIRKLTPTGGDMIIAKGIAGNTNTFGLSNDITLSNGQLYMVRPTGWADVINLGTVRPNGAPGSYYTADVHDFTSIAKDAAGNFTQTMRDGTKRMFNAAGFHIQTTTPRGLSWYYQYDQQNHLAIRTNAAGQQWTFAYNGNAISQMTDPAGRITRFTVDANNNLVRVDEPGGAFMTYIYDSNHKVLSKTDNRGFTSSYLYGPQGNLLQMTQANGEVRKFTSGRMATAVTAAVAAATSSTNLINIVETEDTYTNGAGATTRYLTNGYGSIERVVDPVGNVSTTSHNQHGQTTTAVEANGATTIYTYDARNRLVAEFRPNLYAQYTYDLLDRLISTSSNFGAPIRITYDANNNPVQIAVGPMQELTTTYTYNAFGEVLSETTDGKMTQYTYDSAGHRLTRTDPLGQTTNFTYDQAGDLIQIKDALGNISSFAYDAAGRLVKSTDPLGAATTYVWQAACATCGRATQLLMSVTDAIGRTTTFDYDELGQRIRETDAAGQIKTYTYDANRNLATITQPNGAQIVLTYDALDRLIKKTLPTGVVNYSYDSVGNLVSAANTDSSLAYTYDQAKRVTGITANGPSQTTENISVNSQGYLVSQLNGSVGNSNLYENRSFDALFRETALDHNGLTSFSYDNAGRRSQITYADNSTLAYTYDDASHLTGMMNSVNLEALSYGYDATGRRVLKKLQNNQTTLTSSLDMNPVTANNLNVVGTIAGGATSVTVNGVPMTVTGNTIQGSVPLQIGNNPITVQVTQVDGSIVTDSSNTVARNSLSTGLTINRIDAVSSTGDVYLFLNNQPALKAAGSGQLTTPPWLAQASFISVDSTNRVYTLQNNLLWRHDTTGDTQVVDLTAYASADSNGSTTPGNITSMRVGPDDAVYFVISDVIYRVDTTGNVTTYANLPAGHLLAMAKPKYKSIQVASLDNVADFAELLRQTKSTSNKWSGSSFLANSIASFDPPLPDNNSLVYSLASSSFGLVAADNMGNFYLINSDGTYSSLASYGQYWNKPAQSFAVAPDGTLCFFGTCYNTTGTQIPATWFTTVAFDALGNIYTNGPTQDNVLVAPFQQYPQGQVGLITGVLQVPPVAGTLTITAQIPPVQSTAYSYDATDRLVQATLNGQASENYAYDAVGNHITDPRSQNYQYDALNRLVSGGGAFYTYDANGNRISKTDGNGVTQYTYDAENQLTGISLPGGTSVQYAYDPLGRRIQKTITDAYGTQTVRRYVYDGLKLLFEMDGQDNPVTEFAHGPGIDELISMKQNGIVYTYHTDALGSISYITDSNGTVVQRYGYDSYGNVTGVQDPAFKQPFAYTGRERDEESGLYYYRARYYDPAVGRFLTQDPIGLAGGINKYAYVGGNPVSGVDPLGLRMWWNGSNSWSDAPTGPGWIPYEPGYGSIPGTDSSSGGSCPQHGSNTNGNDSASNPAAENGGSTANPTDSLTNGPNAATGGNSSSNGSQESTNQCGFICNLLKKIQKPPAPMPTSTGGARG